MVAQAAPTPVIRSGMVSEEYWLSHYFNVMPLLPVPSSHLPSSSLLYYHLIIKIIKVVMKRVWLWVWRAADSNYCLVASPASEALPAITTTTLPLLQGGCGSASNNKCPTDPLLGGCGSSYGAANKLCNIAFPGQVGSLISGCRVARPLGRVSTIIRDTDHQLLGGSGLKWWSSVNISRSISHDRGNGPPGRPDTRGEGHTHFVLPSSPA